MWRSSIASGLLGLRGSSIAQHSSPCITLPNVLLPFTVQRRTFALQMETRVVVTDNSGVKRAKVIKNIGGSFKKASSLGDFVIVAVQKRELIKKQLKKNVYLALVTSVRRKTYRKLYGHCITFAKNKVVLLSDQGKLMGTRIKGPVCEEVRRKRIAKIMTIARAVV